MADFFDVRMRGFRDRTELDAACRIVDAHARPLAPETIATAAALGRSLAEAIVSPVDIPRFDRAAMDGYAVAAESTFGAELHQPVLLRIAGEIVAGRGQDLVCRRGEAIRIMTGAPLPPGADAVAPAEVCAVRDDQVLIHETVTPGRHVSRIGEDVQREATILEPPRVLRPQDIGILTAMGISLIAVCRRPRVEILITGDEILPAGSAPVGNQVVDGNSPMLLGLLSRDGCAAANVRLLPDRAELIREAVASSTADIVLISGGSSVGKEDHAPRLVAELGQLHFHGVALRPASPSGFGTIAGKLLFLLPGNPVSCLCAYDLLAARAVRRLGGLAPDLHYPRRTFPLANKIVSAIGRVDYVRVRIVDGRVEPMAVSGASALSTTVFADGFVLVDRDREGFAPGEMVSVYLYDGLHSRWLNGD